MRELNLAEVTALATCGFPVTVHKTRREDGSDSVDFHIAEKSIEYPELDKRFAIRMMRAGTLQAEHPIEQCMAAHNARRIIIDWLKGRVTIGIEKEIGIERWRVIAENQKQTNAIAYKTPDINAAVALALSGYEPLRIEGGTRALFCFNNTRAIPGPEANIIMDYFRGGRMQAEDPRNPFLQYFLTCQNLGAISASARDALAMVYLVKPGAKRHAYIREDSPGAVKDKVKRFFGY